MARNPELDPIQPERPSQKDFPWPFSRGSDRFFNRLSYGLERGAVEGAIMGTAAIGITALLSRVSVPELLQQSPEAWVAVTYGIIAMSVAEGIVRVTRD